MNAGRWTSSTTKLATGRRFRCLTLVDDFTRQCLAIHVDTSIGGASVVAVLQRLASPYNEKRYLTGSRFLVSEILTGS